MKRSLAPLAIFALILTGCGTTSAEDAEQSTAPPVTINSVEAEAEATEEVTEEPTEDPATASAPLGPGTYTLSAPSGTEIIMEVPGEAPADIEEFRELAGASPVTYITANVDNREGEDTFDLYQVFIYDEEGNEYAFAPANDYLSEIGPSTEDVDLYNRHIDVSNAYSTVVNQMERADVALVGPELPESFAGVVVSNGFEQFEAAPVAD